MRVRPASPCRRRGHRGRMRHRAAVAARPPCGPPHDVRSRRRRGRIHDALAGSARSLVWRIRGAERRLRLQIAVHSSHRRARPLALLVAMALMPQPGAALHAAETVESHQYRYMMGTSIEVQAFGGDEAIRRSAIDEAFEAFADIDRLMSNYRDDSELGALNRNAARESIPVSEPMFAVLDAARRVSEAS